MSIDGETAAYARGGVRSFKQFLLGCLGLVFAGCFAGEFAQGLPCSVDADCGPQWQCVDGLCGGRGGAGICGNGLVEEGEQCDDGNILDGDGCSPACRKPAICGNGTVEEDEACDDGNSVENDACTDTCTVSPEMPTLELNLAQVKRVEFHWEPVRGADWYELYEQTSAGSEYVQLGEVVGASYSQTVSVHRVSDVKYKLRACNAQRCTESAEVVPTGNLAAAIGYFKASNAEQGDVFGGAVVMSKDGNTLAVRAHLEDGGSRGIDHTNETQMDNSAEDSGAVYVYRRKGETWLQEAYIKASNADDNDFFGEALDLSDDGNTLVVGAKGEDGSNNSAHDAGAVYTFSRVENLWTETARINSAVLQNDALFGNKLALSGDGNVLVVSDETSQVYVYKRVDSGWVSDGVLASPLEEDDDGFGSSMALSHDGRTLVVGAENDSNNTTGVNAVVQPDQLAENSGAVHVFDLDSSEHTYIKSANTETEGYFGSSVALSDDGNTLAVGANAEGNGGSVSMFGRTQGIWAQEAYIKASNANSGDGFGWSVALSTSGSTLAVGAAFERSSASGVGGDQSDNSLNFAGAVYLYTRTGETWDHNGYIKARHTAGGDFFGHAVCLSGDATTLAVGTPGENYATTGVGHEPGTSVAFNSGAVYLY